MFYIFEQKQGKFTFYIFMRAKKTVDGNRVVEDGREGEIKGELQGKGGERRKTGRYGWGGMKGNGENVGEDKRKEERNDGRKVCTLTESTPVLT